MAPTPATSPAEAQVARNPVVFVHGFASSNSVWDTLAADFRAAGYGSNQLFFFTYDTFFTSNTTTAQRLATFVDQVRQQTGASRVDMISHSMGGLSSRQCVKSFGCAGEVDDWVSLAGANHGTATALLCALFLVTCQEMSPGSAYLTALNAAPEVTSGANSWATLWSPNDGVIVPAQSTVLQGANNIQVSSAINHFSILTDQAVADRVLQLVA